jgi:hypothetical protein
MKYEYPKESVKTRIINRLNYLNKWIENYNKNPPRYLATPNMLKCFERMFTDTTRKLDILIEDPEEKWIEHYHGETLTKEPYHDFRIETNKSTQYWVKLTMPLDPQKNKQKYETHYLGLITNKKGQLIDFKTNLNNRKLLKALKLAYELEENVCFDI